MDPLARFRQLRDETNRKEEEEKKAAESRRQENDRSISQQNERDEKFARDTAKKLNDVFGQEALAGGHSVSFAIEAEKERPPTSGSTVSRRYFYVKATAKRGIPLALIGIRDGYIFNGRTYDAYDDLLNAMAEFLGTVTAEQIEKGGFRV